MFGRKNSEKIIHVKKIFYIERYEKLYYNK